jgi:hypothetical protein
LRRAAAYVLFLVALASVAAAQSFTARIDGEQLHVAAPRIHLLTGEALQRLKNGATVIYELQLSARPDRTGKLLANTVERFAVSYDLWEEKFAVAKLGRSPKSVSHLSSAAAEAWCMDNTSLPVGPLPDHQSFWLRLDFRAEDPAAPAEQADNSSFTLSGLVDIFSRRTRAEQVHGSEESGPLRLDSLKKR